MTSLQDRIISVFIDKQTRVLNDTDVSNELVTQGIPCDAADVCRHVRLLSPALFQLIFNEDRTTTIRVEPTIEICEQFLGNKCSAAARGCDKLHMCRHIDGHCPTPNCHFPHDFTRGYNRKIVTDHRCQHIDSVLLVKLLRLRKFPLHVPPPFSSRPPHTGGSRGGRGFNNRRPNRNRRRPRPNFTNQASSRNFPVQKDDSDRQVDVSFPSSTRAKQIDMEIIGMLLNINNIKVENKLTENENEYWRRGTIQLEHINDLEKLLVSPIINHQGFNIKFKRTKQIIDKTSFILKTSIKNEQDKIDPQRFDLYASTLVGNNASSKISDLSSDSEQIMLVQYTNEIDFDKVREGNKFRPQLLNKQITLIQIYECDALEIRYNIENKSITENELKIIFKFCWADIFAYNFPSTDYAEVEFINPNAFKQWMSTSDSTQNKYNVIISPIIDSVDDNNVDIRSTTSSGFEGGSRQTTIKLRPDWAMIIAHPKFKVEYKEFIHNEFGGDIDINGDEGTYNGTFPKHVHGSRDEVILRNKTDEFIRKFECKTFTELEQNHLDILRTNSTTVAFSRIKENDYMVATKLHGMLELKRQLFAKKTPRPQPKPQYPTTNPKLSSAFPSSTTETHSPPAISSTTSMYLVTNPEGISMFSIETFEDRLRQYLQETFNVKPICERYSNNNEKTKGAKNGIRIKITGQMADVDNAIQDLGSLFSSLCTKKLDDQTDGNWTKIEEATQVLQHHFNLADLICTCQQISPTNVDVYYFDITNPRFGVDEQRIEDLIKDKFRSATIPYNQQSVSLKFTKDWTDLEDQIRTRNDYKKNICLYKESNNIYLFGLIDLVKEFRQKFEQLKNKHNPQPCKITLSERQLNYLTYVAKADMNKLEKQYKSYGCDVSLTLLRHSCEFIAPPDMHSKIKDNIEALAQIRTTSFDVIEPGFDVLISKEPDRLLSLVKTKCFLEKTIDTHRDNIPIPKSRVADLEDGVKQPSTASATASALPNVTSVSIGHSIVTILIGDLTAQKVDAIVACSSSDYLCKAIIKTAGAQVQAEYIVLKTSGQFPGTTSNGSLPCKEIFFIPWSPNSHDIADVKSSLSLFISMAFHYASSKGYKSIAFPAVGCGKLNFDPSIIAKYMLRETQNQLKASKIKMNISFILFPGEQNVYDAFLKRLNEMQTIDLTVSHKIPIKKKDDPSTIAYDRKIIKITLISSNDHHLIKCKEDILNLARTFSTKVQLTNKQDMLDWTQNTIYKYYESCLKQRIIPTLDLTNTTLELVGARDAVHEMEKYFYELTSETLKQARIHAVSQGVIWSVELTPNSDSWEQYSFKLNGIIEDTSLKKYPYVDFENEKEEKCRIIFSTMLEHCSTRIRRVRRKLVDSTFPKTWEPSDKNCKRVILQISSEEYQNVLAQFHVTMLGKYSKIVKIERIQNERWYKQYAAHRDDFERRYSQPDERLLFHGCPSSSADLIIPECFNRAFAGVNGVAFGCGVYFHAQANYSHQYAHANIAGERTMFLARVLIGKTCKGDKSMKVVPTGYDTTTDGVHIFVVYHDAGAYADHLITYK